MHLADAVAASPLAIDTVACAIAVAPLRTGSLSFGSASQNRVAWLEQELDGVGASRRLAWRESKLRRFTRQSDQYWSELMISPPARVTRAAINWTEAMSLMKWTDPSTNRQFAPPG